MVKTVEQIIKEKDMARCDLVVEAYKPLIISAIRKYFYRDYLYEDLFQEGVLILCECVRDYKPDTNVTFKAFLNSRLKFYFLGLNRSRQYMTDYSLDYITDECGEKYSENCFDKSDCRSIDKLYEQKELYDKLVDNLVKLTDKQRKVVIDFYVKGVSIVDIAKDLGVTYRTCYNIKTNAIDKLRSLTFENEG